LSFSSFGLDSRLLRGIQELGFTEATPIQRDAIPAALAGRDVLASAQTGSGKTAAFVIPILQRLATTRGRGSRALVITPTRELAVQIEEHVRDLGRYAGVSSVKVYGGVSMHDQRLALRAGAQVVIATPGRLLDHIGRRNVNFNDLEMLVLDEADRMLDMGFMPDVRRILSHLPKDRQTLFFSATIPSAVASLSQSMLQSPVTIDVERRAAPAEGITHGVYAVRSDLKTALLVELLRTRKDMESVLVFTRTRLRTDRVAEFLEHHRVRFDWIHGDRSQALRTRALEDFKARRSRVLVATDIAARGLDITDLTHVVNLDVPQDTEDYIHRVGRTARAGAAGEAWTFVGVEEEQDLRSIEKGLGMTFPRLTLDPFTDSYRSVVRPLPRVPTGLVGNRRPLVGGSRR
jgi:ATP-dependent RNA helicase RhlE